MNRFNDDGVKRMMILPELLPLHKKIRAKRLLEGFSTGELAEILGCARSTLNQVEQGRRKVPRKSAAAVQKYVFEDVYINKKLYTGRDD